ncbi:PqqD family peptide modification chaperone [Bradyrhizobium tropiciagri]|uniref:PqqD family peptide modification chaperone n=1 Tax=Bradyrhizobium tropiciagri TaxID=312253 RepID=UPI001BA4B390|nr:PqqD family peptide modification chaperone [Bradyrhizobium tropiciagri]MBR0874891.1 PqqD family peptide modification chaperone [Bradyrhizobium tropiciagri]
MTAGPFLSPSWYRVARRKPKLREHTSVCRHRYRGSAWYIIQDHATGRVHRLSPAGYLIVAAMDGVRTVDRLWLEACSTLEEEAPSQGDVIQLLAQLNAHDLLQTDATPDPNALEERAARAGRTGWLANALYPLAIRVPLWHPDRFFERIQPLARWLFGVPGTLLWLVVVLPALVLAAQHWQELGADASYRILAADNLVPLALIYVVLKVLHEFGHGFAVKAFGGAVHELGLMILVFAPLPYVDASAAAGFRSKWQRALVGAAGMIVEVFFAALALYVWLAVEGGLVRALAFDAMVIAGVSTVIFNGNPLLRYDGYYILADLLEIPNLAQRATKYWGDLVDRYVFRTEGSRDFVATGAEKAWLLLYAPAAFVYRQFVMLTIAVFVASQYLAVGIAIAVWSLLTGVVRPIGKALWFVLASPRLQRNRARAVGTTCAALLATTLVLFWVPVPSYTTTEGVVWLPENAIVRAGADGFVRALTIAPGSSVTSGDTLVESEDPALATGVEILRARVTELEAKLASERFTDRVRAEITTTELEQARAELATAADRADRLIVRSRSNGTFAVMKAEDLAGRYLREGQQIGYVLATGSCIVRATISQADIDLVRHRLRRASVFLAERLDAPVPAEIVREVPAGRDDLPSKALGSGGGGPVAVNPSDPHGTKTLQRVFQVDIALPGDAAASAFGSRAYVRFDYDWEPAGRQILRRLQQLLLSQLQI